MQETDGNLLKRFATQGEEAAFEALAARYLGLIFHTAMRRTGSRPVAEEVSQNVLCAVVKKASSLARNPERLSAWVHRATLFESSKAMRKEASNQRRKKLRHPDQIEATHVGDDSPWHAALPHLDEALDRLSESERRVVLKHYFEGLGFSRIGEQQSRPAATVQKQCRRAIDKLARILRGKGVALSAAVLASGLGTQFAKAAPVVLLKSATTTALGGTIAYSSTQLTLFMAMKSKAVLPITLLVLLTPLGLQQLAISRATAHNESLRLSLGEGGKAKGLVLARPTATVSVPSGKITIDELSRAQMVASKFGALKEIEFEEMLASLDADELEVLIPQAFKLQRPQSNRMDLLRSLVGSLTVFDPERAVRVTCGVDPRNPLIHDIGVEPALSLWTSERPDDAIDWLKSILEDRRGMMGSLKESPYALDPFQAVIVGELIMAGSSRVREVVTLVPEFDPDNVVRDAISRPNSVSGSNFREVSLDESVERFSRFLPWIREYVSEEGGNITRRQTIEYLLGESMRDFWPNTEPVVSRVMETADLLPEERLGLAEEYALDQISKLYNSQPRPERTEVEGDALNWLQTYQPDVADEIFENAKEIARQRGRSQLERQLSTLSSQLVVRDADLVRDLNRYDFREFPEFLPRAIKQARRIKNSTTRMEILRLLESQQEKP